MFTHVLSILLFLLTPSDTFMQQFEGEIVFAKESRLDTTYYSYYVKGNKIRFNELDADKNISLYLLVDLEKEAVTAVKPNQQLYSPLKIRPKNQVADELKIIKTPNSKVIKGYTCYQWRVINKAKDTEVAYWVAKDGFAFFEDVLRLLDRSEETLNYFISIPGNEGYFPFEVTERSILREFKSKHQAISVTRNSLSNDLFEIPTSYSIFYPRN